MPLLLGLRRSRFAANAASGQISVAVDTNLPLWGHLDATLGPESELVVILIRRAHLLCNGHRAGPSRVCRAQTYQEGNSACRCSCGGDKVRVASSSTRVLMILDSFSFGGAENLIAELGRHAPGVPGGVGCQPGARRQGRNAMSAGSPRRVYSRPTCRSAGSSTWGGFSA